ncbi:MAG: hypothetical protein AAF675_14235 [Pseudomonadota bacterium]
MADEVFVGLFLLVAFYVLWPRSGTDRDGSELPSDKYSDRVQEEFERSRIFDDSDPASPFYKSPIER